MPLYEFRCQACGNLIEDIFSVEECPKTLLCSCGKRAKKTISNFSAHDDHPAWLYCGEGRTVADYLQCPNAIAAGEKKIESRTDYEKVVAKRYREPDFRQI